MEEYIRKLLEQVRFQKAHKAIEDEIRSHIEDQTEAYILDGMDKETAEKRAVRDMGDPVEAGISLDSVHRPKMAWSVVIAAFIVAAIGTALRLIMTNELRVQVGNQVFMDNIVFTNNTVIGIVLMLLLYLIDYTTVAKYSRVAGFILVSILIFAGTIGFLHWYGISYVEPRFWLHSIPAFIYDGFSGGLRALMIPLYAGILYKYKGQNNKGLIKALIWIVITGVAGFYVYVGIGAYVLTGAMLVQLTVAINKEWIKVKKAPVLISVWSAFILFLTYYMRSFKDTLNINYSVSDEMTRRRLGAARLFGRSFEGKTLWSDNVLTYVSLSMGIFAALVVIAVVAAIIVIGLRAVSKTRNQLGNVMGIGCVMWLTFNAVIAVLDGFGVLPTYSNSAFLPFITGGFCDHGYDIIVAYIMLGILLSIYKYKDAYAEHVDITIRKKTKELGV